MMYNAWTIQLSADASSNDEGGEMQLELNQAKDTIYELKKRERELTDRYVKLSCTHTHTLSLTQLLNSFTFSTALRLSEQAQRHLQDSERFEDILLGTSRPTMVIQRYDELFSQGRMDALDTIDQVEDQTFGNHLVLDVFKVGTSHPRNS